MSNMAIIAGRLGSNAEIKTVQSTGKEYARFSLAVDSGWGDNKSTEWCNVTAFGPLGLFKYLLKGAMVLCMCDVSITKKEDKTYRNYTAIKMDMLQWAKRDGDNAIDPGMPLKGEDTGESTDAKDDEMDENFL